MMNVNFARLALTELRVAAVDLKYERVSNKRLLEAMTINEELMNLGYTLTPDGIRILSKASNMTEFLELIRDAIGGVDAKPMYPDFPTQVMDMDEAMFRLHQSIHYFSTYGVEWLTGEEVDKGWLPNVKDTEKTLKDTRLLEAKVIELFPYSKTLTLESICYPRVVSKRERMTSKDRELLRIMLPNVDMCTLVTTEIPFKQNNMIVCNSIIDSDKRTNHKKNVLQSICKNTGDVWKMLDYVLTQHDFHLKTSQKRLIVQLLESYDISDFRENLYISRKKGERVKLMIKYLDYNTYSRSADHRRAVSDLLRNKLTSWESSVKELVNKHDPFTVSYIWARPGMALRWLTYMLRNGYTADDILDASDGHVHKLSTQTLVTILNKFGSIPKKGTTEAETVMKICRELIADKLNGINALPCGRKIYVDDSKFDLTRSELLANDKSDEGGYIRSGIAYRIPENVDKVRLFTYWNDKKRVDIDLHAYIKYGKTAPSDVLKDYDFLKNFLESFIDGGIKHVGFNSDFNESGVVTSGDMTCSDSAEYIDMYFGDEYNKYDVDKVLATIDLYNHSDIGTFKDIETCYVGMMAIDQLGKEFAIYNPDNCFFTHYLTSNTAHMLYGLVDIKHRTITFLGKSTAQRGFNCYGTACEIFDRDVSDFTLDEYLNILIESQGCTRVATREEADNIIVMEKATEPNEISLIDRNFFMDS